MTRGGRRPGAGRPFSGKTSTKITVYEDTRNTLNEYANKLGMPLVQVMEELTNSQTFYDYLKSILNK